MDWPSLSTAAEPDGGRRRCCSTTRSSQNIGQRLAASLITNIRKARFCYLEDYRLRIISVGMLVGALPAAAEPTIPIAYVKVAQECGVPPKLLYAVALTESALRLDTRAIRPWPWTLNVEGKPERYRSRAAALKAIQRHLAAGRRSIDIGLMQVNWRWHRGKLRDPWTALDPYFNLRTGARILRERFRESGDWLTAAGRYHAPASTRRGRALASAYRHRVERQLARLKRPA